MATVILCVGSPVSSTDRIIVVLPLVCSSSAFESAENNIYIPTIPTPYIILIIETDESAEFKTP